MSTVPTYAGTAHGEVSNGYSWNADTNQWVDVTHLVATDKAVIEAEVNQSLQALGVTDEVIDRLFEKAATVDKPIETPEDFEAADRVRKEIQKVRRIGESNMESIHGRYVALWKASGDVKKRTLARLMEPEEVVLKHIGVYRRKQEMAEEAERERVRMLMEQRQRDILDLKFNQVGSMWVLEGLEVPVDQVMHIDPDGWKNLYTSMRMHSESVFREREERAEAMRVEAERLEKEKAEMAKREQELREKEEKMRSQITANRLNELVALGCTSDGTYVSVNALPNLSLYTLPIELLHTYDDNAWSTVLQNAKTAVDEAKATNAAYEEEQERLRKEANEQAIAAAQEAIRKQAEEEAARAEKAQQERIARDGDLEVLRQAEVIITSAGSKLGGLLTVCQSAVGAAAIATAKEALLMAHKTVTTTQHAIQSQREQTTEANVAS